MRLSHLRVVLFSAVAGCVFPLLAGASVRMVLEAPSVALVQGEAVTVSLLLTNESDRPVTESTAAGLGLVARLGSRAEAFTLARAADAPASVTLEPGSYVRIAYSGALPAGMMGFIVLQDSSQRFGAAALQVDPASAVASAESRLASATASAPGDAPSAAAAEDKGVPVSGAEEPAFAGSTQPPRRSASDLGLMAYEPIYFSVGDGGGLNARFQLSLKYRPFGPGSDHIAGEHWWQDIYFAFTQTSVWDLHSESNPFYDSSYRPAIFYGRHATELRLFGAEIGYTAGLEHESNGKDGADSRSINMAFFRPELRWGDLDGKKWRVTFAPKLYVYLEKGDNKDIADYRGYGDYNLAVEWKDSFKISTSTRIGTDGHASFLMDVSYPFSRINDLVPIGWAHGYLHLQFFRGYGETILDYNRRDDTQVRLGLMLIR